MHRCIKQTAELRFNFFIADKIHGIIMLFISLKVYSVSNQSVSSIRTRCDSYISVLAIESHRPCKNICAGDCHLYCEGFDLSDVDAENAANQVMSLGRLRRQHYSFDLGWNRGPVST